MEKIVLNIEPKGQMRPRFTTIGGRVRAYENPKMKQWRNLCSSIANEAYDGECCEVSPEMEIRFFMPTPKNMQTKKNMALLQSETIPHIKKPDVDNLAKAVLDSITGIVITDDNSISDLKLSKRYSLAPRIEIFLKK